MGCGCKGDKKSPNLINKKTGELNLKGKLLKVPTALFYTTLMIIISPFLLVFIWYLVMISIFDSKSNVIDLMLSKFQKRPIDESEDFNEGNLQEKYEIDDYEIINVDIIK